MHYEYSPRGQSSKKKLEDYLESKFNFEKADTTVFQEK